MKKALMIVLILLLAFVGGKEFLNNPSQSFTERDIEPASFTERNIYASAERSCFCIVAKEDIGKMLEAAHRKDVEYLDAMLADGRAFVVKEMTKVKCSDSEERRGIVLVNFLEGEFKGRWAYTFSKRVR